MINLLEKIIMSGLQKFSNLKYQYSQLTSSCREPEVLIVNTIEHINKQKGIKMNDNK